eukprot:Rhum_TRINITY_DN21271_c0_g1::Rhum_TRINITY_DN21271_c0_g1_i1::g.173607::m.173607
MVSLLAFASLLRLRCALATAATLALLVPGALIVAVASAAVLPLSKLLLLADFAEVSFAILRILHPTNSRDSLAPHRHELRLRRVLQAGLFLLLRLLDVVVAAGAAVVGAVPLELAHTLLAELLGQVEHPLRHLLVAGPLDDVRHLAQVRPVLVRPQRDGDARVPRTPRTAHTVHIRLDGGREVEVDDGGDALEVHTARHQLRRDQHVDLAQTELAHAAVALVCRAVGVDGGHADVLRGELRVQVLRTVDALHEDEHGRGEPLLQQLLDGLGLPALLAAVFQALLHVARGRGTRADHDTQRVLEELTDDALALLRQGGGEDGDLLVLERAQVERALHHVEEGVVQRVEKLVRLVEHDVLDGAQCQVVLLDERLETPRRGAQDVPLVHGSLRRRHRLDAPVLACAQVAKLALALRREFLGVRHHQPAQPLLAGLPQPR